MRQRGEYMREHSAEWEGTFTVMRETEKAMLLWDGDGTSDSAQWVPKSQIKHVNKTEKVDVVHVTMAEWIAKEKGFI